MMINGITWDNAGDHFYNTGIDGVALYVFDNSINWYGVANSWSGVTAVNESPSGAESNKQYADNLEYLNLLSKEEFGLTLEAFQVPEAFDECDGIKPLGQLKVRGQSRKPFGLVYRVQKGSDTVEAGGAVNASAGVPQDDDDGSGEGYIYHIVYGCRAAPSSRDYGTVNDSPEAQTFSYEITCSDLTDTSKISVDGGTTISDLTGVTKLCHIEVDSSKLTKDQLDALKAILYGTEDTSVTPSVLVPAETMPTPAEIYTACATVSSNG